MLAALTLSYSYWLILLCLLGAAALTGLLYYKNSRMQELPKATVYFLMALRFSAVFLLLFLLLKPLLRSIVNQYEKPVLGLLIDNSRSVTASSDSTKIAAEIEAITAQIQTQLGSAYDVVPLLFGEDLVTGTPNFTANQTDFSNAFQLFFEGYKNANVGGIVMLTDGITTKGITPETLGAARRFKFIGVGLGDTTTRNDARIREVVTNQVAFTGNKFPVEVFAQVDGLKGKSGKIAIYSQGKIVVESSFQTKNDRDAITEKFLLEAGKPGLMEYQVRITEYPNEENFKNNRFTFFIDVKEKRKKIALVTDAAHPDIAALKRSLAQVAAFELAVFYSNDLPATLSNFDLLILHQYPGRFAKGTPNAIAAYPNNILYILGSNMDLPTFKRTQKNVGLDGGIAIETLLPTYNTNFTLFALPQETQQFFKDLPPLEGLMSPLQFTGTGENLLTYKIGRVETGRPMVYLGSNAQNKKIGVVNGTGIWRWRMEDYKRNNKFSHFDQFVSQTIQYLTTDELRERLEVLHEKRFTENGRISFEGVLLNANLEPVNQPELRLEISNAGGKKFQYTFGKLNDRYQLAINNLPAGTYTYTASTQLGKETFTKRGAFLVAAVEVEFVNLQAQHQWMRELASATKGQFFNTNQTAALIDFLLTTNKAPERIKTRIKTKTLLNEPLLLVLIVVLLGTEWFIRKRSGIY